MTLPDAEIRSRDARAFSKLGFASIAIGVIIVFIIGYLAWLFALWLLGPTAANHTTIRTVRFTAAVDDVVFNFEDPDGHLLEVMTVPETGS